MTGAASLGARAAPSTSKVEVDISHRYGPLVVHEELRFSVMENEFLCVSGPSGCGKTTLLDILAGILQPSEGQVLIDGRPVDPKRDRISFVFQEPSTLPWLNVWDNVATGLRRHFTSRAWGCNSKRGLKPHRVGGATQTPSTPDAWQAWLVAA